MQLQETIDVFQILSDPTRVRLLALLQGQELSVTELVAVTELPQSRISTHLGKLREAGLVQDRRAGTSSFYRLSAALPPAARKLWPLLQRELSGAELAADAEKLVSVLAARRRGAGWPERVAGEMERHYSPGRTWEATCRAFAGLLELGDVLDVGSGDGAMAELIAPSARSIVCLDSSLTVEAAARIRLARFAHVRSVCADMHALPLRDSRFDTVLLFNVLSYSREPTQALREAARVLRPGGSLALVTLDAHEHMGTAEAYGHVQAGFAPAALRAMLQGAGLSVRSCEVSCKERQSPRFAVVEAFARREHSGRRPS